MHADGYGHLTYRRKYWLAHRLAWTLKNGEIPAGMCVCHKCDNRACCNTDHMFLGSHSDNMADMKQKGRRLNINIGELNGRAKISHACAQEIRALYAKGEKQKTLAARFGIGQSMISCIVRGTNWR